MLQQQQQKEKYNKAKLEAKKQQKPKLNQTKTQLLSKTREMTLSVKKLRLI